MPRILHYILLFAPRFLILDHTDIRSWQIIIFVCVQE